MSLSEGPTKGTILFVDDEQSILNALHRIFIPLNYTVWTANSGQAGLDLLSEHTVDIIVSDMRMPEMDGAEFLKKAAKQCPESIRVLLTGYTDINAAILAINEGGITHYLSKPWKNEQITSMVQTLVENKKIRDKNKELQKVIEKQNSELVVLNADLEKKVEQRTQELKATYKDLQDSYGSAIQVFLSLVEMHEGALVGHNRCIAELTKILAKELNLAESQIQHIYLAAMLHDIGKIGLSSDIKAKPYTTLSKLELDEFSQYPMLGATALLPFSPLKEVAEYIMHHREHYDGTGFPNKLKAEEIPLGARILSIAVDYYDFRHGLIYKEKGSAQFGLQYVKDHSRFYDPQLVLIFMKIIKDFAYEQAAFAEVPLSPKQLEAGMVLSRDLISKNGFLLMPKGHVFTPELVNRINRIKTVSDLTVYVRESPQR